jgi:hypothetical protein
MEKGKKGGRKEERKRPRRFWLFGKAKVYI